MCAIELSLREAQQVEARLGRATADAGGASTPSRTPPRDARRGGGGCCQPAPEPEPVEQELEPEPEPSVVAAPQSAPASEPAPSSAKQATCIHRP
jgi:hypothetical protein